MHWSGQVSVCLGFPGGKSSVAESRAPWQPTLVKVSDFIQTCVGFHGFFIVPCALFRCGYPTKPC